MRQDLTVLLGNKEVREGKKQQAKEALEGEKEASGSTCLRLGCQKRTATVRRRQLQRRRTRRMRTLRSGALRGVNMLENERDATCSIPGMS